MFDEWAALNEGAAQCIREEAITMNGWANRATWLAAVYGLNELDANDPEVIRIVSDHGVPVSMISRWLGENMRLQFLEMVDESLPIADSMIEAGSIFLMRELLINTAFNEINWSEMARVWVADNADALIDAVRRHELAAKREVESGN